MLPTASIVWLFGRPTLNGHELCIREPVVGAGFAQIIAGGPVLGAISSGIQERGNGVKLFGCFEGHQFGLKPAAVLVGDIPIDLSLSKNIVAFVDLNEGSHVNGQVVRVSLKR